MFGYTLHRGYIYFIPLPCPNISLSFLGTKRFTKGCLRFHALLRRHWGGFKPFESFHLMCEKMQWGWSEGRCPCTSIVQTDEISVFASLTLI